MKKAPTRGGVGLSEKLFGSEEELRLLLRHQRQSVPFVRPTQYSAGG